MKKDILYLVVPCYNEEEVLEETTKQLTQKFITLIEKGKIHPKSKILYVNDGSTDRTWELITSYHQSNSFVTGICLSRNQGHQNALLAGLMTAKQYADVVISMDADLQDDINSIEEMITHFENGYDIVYGVRKNRKKDSWLKRTTAETFYRFMQSMGVNIIFNHADYRLTSQKVLESLEQFPEVNLFLRGLFPLMGYSYTTVFYERKKRFAGKSKYPFRKMCSFAWEGITSFSIKPIHMVFHLGILIFIVSIFMTLYSVIAKLLGNTVPGWTFINCSIWMLAGIQMLSLGLIGEYIGKVYSETKARPKYLISRNLLEEETP